MKIVPEPAEHSYDLIVVGTGFASSFYLAEWLRHAPLAARVLVLERGGVEDHRWQIQNQKSTPIPLDLVRRGHPRKAWSYTLGFGGGSRCWTGCVPRMLPNDFQLQSRYGVGVDWPIDYSDLEPFYSEVEIAMQVSGPDDNPIYPRSVPHPQPPHNLCEPEMLLVDAFPGAYFPQAAARPRVAVPGRPACCASSRCHLCPMDAKFTIQNAFMGPYDDERVSVVLHCDVERVITEGGRATGVEYRDEGRSREVRGEFVALGANAIFNAAIMLRSGFDHPRLGRRLHEQISTSVIFDLAGVENFQGSTLITGQGYMFYDGPHRREHGACMTEWLNAPGDMARLEPGRWLERAEMTFIVEDLPREENRVHVENGSVVADFRDYSEYGKLGLERVRQYADRIAGILPVERMTFRDAYLQAGDPRPTEWHIQGTVAMGSTVEQGVVDSDLLCFSCRNLAVLGSSSFPTGAPANPTLTLSALSVRAARRHWQ